MATSISKTSVAVGMDASAFKTGAESLKGYFKDIGASAGKLVGVLGLASLSFAGIKAGIEGSLGKVVAFEKTQAILEAIGTSAGSSKESIANLVSTLSAITGRNDEAGKALGDMARKMMSVGFSAAETEKLVTSFYKTAKAVPGEISQTYSMLEKMALQLDEMGFVEFGQFKALAELGLPIMDIFAQKISEMRGVVVSTEEVVAQLKLAQQTGGASGITTQEQLQVFAGLGDSEAIQAQAEAVGNTFAGAMGKAKGEISLMFFEIGKAINAFFGGTKTYVSLFKTITAGVKAAREQVELLTGVFANNRQWIEDFKNGIDILVVAFFRGFEVMGQQLMESKRLIGEWFDTWRNNNAVSSKLDEAAGKTNLLTELFKGFGDYMEEFASNFEAIFEVWNVILDSFGDGVSNVTNIWEGMYEIIQTIKTAAQVGFLAIAEIGINSVNGILKVFEDMAAFTQKWIDKFSYGLTNILEALGLVSKGTTDAMMAQDKARGNVTFNLGRIGTEGMAEGRAAIQAQAEEERRARIKMYNERKLGLNKDLPTAENPDFARGKGGAGGAGSQLAAPTLLSAGGAEEYKLIVERNNAKLMDGAKKTNDLLEQANGHLETIAGNRPIAPAMTVVPMIPRG
jgi:hypothetical protein